MKPIKAWWFSRGYKLPHGDGREIQLGITHEVEGEIIPCANGLHASIRPRDALRYACGAIIWRVELSGKVVTRDDKLAASKRTYLEGGIDISEALKEFARLCALDVVHLWDCPESVLKYLKTGDEELRAAAWSAARSATGSAAGAAQCAADASWPAVWSAAQCAAIAAQYAGEQQNQRLTAMFNNEIKNRGAV